MRIDTRSTEEPEVAVVVLPRDGAVTGTWPIGGGCLPGSAEKADTGRDIAAAFPRPLLTRGRVLPKIVEVPVNSERVVPKSAKEPEIAARIGPADCAFPRTGEICGGRCTEGAIDAHGICWIGNCRGPALPGPLAGRGGGLPKISEGAVAGQGCTVTISSEEPEIAIGIGPGDRTLSRTGHIGRRCVAERSVNACAIRNVGSPYPRPLTAYRS